MDVYNGRDYELFGVLAGVRCTVAPFVQPRGIPDNLSCEVKNEYGDGDWYHTPTWYDYCELNAYSHMLSDSTKELKRKNNEIKELRKKIEEFKHDADDAHYVDEDIEYLDYYDEEYDVAGRLASFISCIDVVLEAYYIYYPNPGDVRVVMWFNS